MEVRPAVTLVEAASRLGVTPQRISQLLKLGVLSGPDVGLGRARKHAPRVWESSLRREVVRRQTDGRRGAGQSSAGTTDLVSKSLAREAAAMEAALQMKLRLDEAREALRRERQANQKLTSVLATVTAELQVAQGQADRLDNIAAGYSDALTQLMIPDGPEVR